MLEYIALGIAIGIAICAAACRMSATARAIIWPLSDGGPGEEKPKSAHDEGDSDGGPGEEKPPKK